MTGLQLRPKPEKHYVFGHSTKWMDQAQHRNDVWSQNSVMDRAIDRRALNDMRVEHDSTCERLAAGCTQRMTPTDVQNWLSSRAVAMDRVQTGTPWQNCAPSGAESTSSL